MTALRLGVDFGTSSTVAVLQRPDGTSGALLFDGSPLLASAVFAAPDALLTGLDAVRAASGDPAAFEPHPKRHIDDGTLWLGGREIPVTDVVAAVFARVDAEARRVAGGPAEQVVLTHPAAWGRVRLAVLATAARQAGWARVAFVPEPVAAAAYFAGVLGSAVSGRRSLVVYDLGAGTFDVSVVRGGPVVTATAGLPDVGGLDLDAAVIGHARAHSGAPDDVWARLAWPTTPAEQRARQQLWQEARAAKEQLSRHATADLHVPVADTTAHLSRDELEELARPLLEPTVALTVQTLRDAGVQPESVAGVLLVGGGSRLPLAATLLHRALRIPPTVIDQPELVVATGSLHAEPTPPTQTQTPTPTPTQKPDSEPQSAHVPEHTPEPAREPERPPEPARRPGRVLAVLVPAAWLILLWIMSGTVHADEFLTYGVKAAVAPIALATALPLVVLLVATGLPDRSRIPAATLAGLGLPVLFAVGTSLILTSHRYLSMLFGADEDAWAAVAHLLAGSGLAAFGGWLLLRGRAGPRGGRGRALRAGAALLVLVAFAGGTMSKLWYTDAAPADPMLDRDGYGVALYLISMSDGVLHGIAVNACFAVGLATTLALVCVPATAGRIAVQARYPQAGPALRAVAGGGLAVAGVLGVLLWARLLTAPTDELSPPTGPLGWGVDVFGGFGRVLEAVSVGEASALTVLFAGISLAVERWHAPRRRGG
ncbi:Hsp70 family protein [Dactylosporangium sp. NPDC050688]|uniref:Hsp70 family protein n=1 Tax=Dactylosporangium sp. NPDC050688 TaxID=3157217 RepID=UPI0034047042